MLFLTFILKNLFRRKLRTILTCIGIAVAVCAMVSLLGVSDGFERAARETFEKRGVDVVVVHGGLTVQTESHLDEKLGERILSLPGVRAVARGLVEVITIRVGKSDSPVFVNGWQPDEFLAQSLEIVSGRRFQGDETKVCLLGIDLAGIVKKSAGDTIEIDGTPFTIVGVFRSPSSFENGGFVVPLKALQRLRGLPNMVTAFCVILDQSSKDRSRMEQVCHQIGEMKDETGRSLRLSARPTDEYIGETIR